ncbi:MAG TPA: glycosyltransferase family 4 protein [Phycisphaerales bacterium]|nr:glycosyltransferase family 4 protein [Phycisphaerales bacterium]
MVTNVLTPYWVHLFLRFAREIPGVKIATCSLFEEGDQPWSLEEVAEIHPYCVGPGEGVRTRTLADTIADYRKAQRVTRWIQQSNIDAVVIGGYADVCRALVIRWCHKHNITVLVFADSNVRSTRPGGLKGWLKKWFLSAIRRMVDGVLVCGRNGADFFTFYNFPPECIHICPVEPDYQLIQSLTEADIAPVLARYNLDPARKRIVACSRLIDIKRVDLAIDAFASIATKRPDWDLVIVGSGPLEPQLKARVPAHLRSRVIFTGFVGSQKDVSAIYRASHVLVHPAEYEPYGLVICEAVAAGMAIVVSSITGAAPEVVGEGVNGRIFPVGNHRLLTTALLDATDERRNPVYRANSLGMLQDWRRRADPVRGLAAALAAMGLSIEALSQPDHPVAPLVQLATTAPMI